MLAHDVWQAEARATPLDNVIDVHIARLRGKMDAPFDKKLLKTVRGVGFILEEEDPPEEEDDPFYMYILAVIGFLAVLLIILFVLYLIIKGKGDEFEE